MIWSRDERLLLSLFRELIRRNVIRVGIAYAAASWVLLQIVDVVSPILSLPEWVPRFVFLLLAVGLVPGLIFAWAFEITPEGLKREKDVDRSQSISRVTGRKLDFTIIAILCLAVVLLAVDRFQGPHPDTTAASRKSIAVLPFVNMSSDAEQEYFSDGITEEILNALATVNELKVTGRTSSFAFKNQQQDLRRIGAALGVAHILEGSVRKSGNRLRITAQLIQVVDGFHLWSQTYDRELTDVFAVQNEIATRIIDALKARLLEGEQESIAAQPTDPAVYELYLLARQRIYSRTRRSLESAVDLLDQAIDKDPRYAPAHAQRGIAALLLSERNYGSIPVEESQSSGKRHLDTAIAIDPQLAEAWAGLGLYHVNIPGEQEIAIDALTRALSLNPNLVYASNWLYLALHEAGNLQAALRVLEEMADRDPLFPPALGNGVRMFHFFGMPEKADALIEKYRAYNPESPQVIDAQAFRLAYRGDIAESLRLAARAFALAPDDDVIHLTFSFGLRRTQQLERLAVEGIEFLRVEALHKLGRYDEAFQLASQLADEGQLVPLFTMLNRASRSKDLVNYVEERWSGIADFAADYPFVSFNDREMAELALAYASIGNAVGLDEALMYIEQGLSSLDEAGAVAPFVFLERSKYFVLIGDHDAALGALEAAVARGLQGVVPLAWSEPALAPLRDEPRFIAAESLMVNNINAARRDLGLEPIPIPRDR